MNLDSIFAQIKQVMHSSAGTKFSFGNPIKVGDLSIIPVAKVSFGFGGGGGTSSNKHQKDSNEGVSVESSESQGHEHSSPKQPEFGGGGGGGIKTDPIGIFTINNDKIKFYPVVTIREVGIALGIMFLSLHKIQKLKRKRHYTTPRQHKRHIKG